MSFRTASTSSQRQALLDLQRTQERLALNQTRVTSHKRITRPGDDPTGSALILDFGNSIEANAQFIKQADSALSFLKSSEDAVTGAVDLSMRLQELAVNGSSASVPELDGIRAILVSLANTQEQGKFLFAGTQTQGSAAHPLPFEDATPPSGPVNYWGNGSTISLDVNATTSVTTNIPGNTAFFGPGGQGSATDIFQVVTDLRDGYTTNNAALIQTAKANLQTAFANLNQVLADLGGRQAGLLDIKDTLSAHNLTLETLQVNQQDTDYAKTAVDLANDQTLQSVTLSTMAKSNKTNLFDYLT